MRVLPTYFLIGLFIGMLYTYLTAPKRKTVYIEERKKHSNCYGNLCSV